LRKRSSASETQYEQYKSVYSGEVSETNMIIKPIYYGLESDRNCTDLKNKYTHFSLCNVNIICYAYLTKV